MIENLRLRLLAVSITLCLIGVLDAPAQEWQQFRGPGARGVSDNAKLPLTWDLEANKNISRPKNTSSIFYHLLFELTTSNYLRSFLG